MPKAPLTERFVQNAVAEQLNETYYRRRSAFVATEAYTRLKRADVFLAFLRAANRPYVVVVEAKSRTTIHQLKLKEAPGQVRWAGRLVATALIIGLSASLGYQWYFNAVNTLLLLSLFMFGSGLISALISKLELSALGAISAIDQLGRYPANEKWIAVGEDTFVRPEDYNTLYRQCKKNGIGLIVVTQKGRMQRKLIPEPRHAFNNYLGSYGKKSDILKTISKRPRYGPTPPEKAKRLRQLLNIGCLLAIVGLLALMSYEERYRPIVPDPFADQVTVPEPPTTEVFPEPPAAEDNYAATSAGAKTEVTERGELALTDCAGFEVTSRAFIVVDALLNRTKAEQRLRLLNEAGLSGFKLLPTECLNSWPAPGRYAIYKDTIFADRPTANRSAKAYKTLLKQHDVPFKYGRAVKVRPGS